MRKSEEHASPAPTWREISQPVRPRAMSREGRRRLVLSGLKTAGLVVLAGAAVWGVVAIAGIWQAEPRLIARAVGTAFVNRIDVQTDGLIGQSWVERTLALPQNITLMELELPPLQRKLLANGQVRSVVLAKTFPSTLTVTISERSPVARLRTENGHDFLVARDGVVFAGIGYDGSTTRESLPWLAGVKLMRTDDGFAPIGDMETVADLLARARNEAPALYRTWQTVNLARLQSDGVIEVQSSEVEKIIFSTNLDFLTQIARLDYVQDARNMPLKSVNVGLGPQVVVDYDAGNPRAADSAHAPAVRPAPAFHFVLPASNPPNHRNTNRDL